MMEWDALALLGRVEIPFVGTELSKASGWLFSDSALIIGVTLALFLALILLVKINHRRKKRRGGSSSGRAHKAASSAGEAEDEDESPHSSGRHRKKRRHRRREHRARNPTLAETGGLPSGPTESKGDSI